MNLNIYGIITKVNDLIYVGSTNKDIQKRFNEHLSEYKRYKSFINDINKLREKLNDNESNIILNRLIKNKGKKFKSYNILDYGQNSIILLENYKNLNSIERDEKERLWIERYKSINLAVNKKLPPIKKEKLNEMQKEVNKWKEDYELNKLELNYIAKGYNN